MKKYFLIIFSAFIVLGAAAQPRLSTKNRNYPIEMDTTTGGIWSGNTASGDNVVDSIYLNNTGLPDFGDLYFPDLEMQVKSLWYDTMLYFLVRHFDDSLVTGYDMGIPDNTVAERLEDKDAAAFYFFTDGSSNRENPANSVYLEDAYLDSIAWFRFGWGSDEFEAVIRDVSVSSISDFGGEMIQWKAHGYNWAKISVDMKQLTPWYIDTVTTITENNDTTYDYEIKVPSLIGFDVELNENDKENEQDGLFEIHTRAFWGSDMDSLALAPRNVKKWGYLYFTTGDDYDPATSGIFFTENCFASVYPNPFSESVFLKFDEVSPTEYKVYNLLGGMVASGSLYGEEGYINLNHLQAGTYFLHLSRKGKSPMMQSIIKL
jgi:hypothetical protein